MVTGVTISDVNTKIVREGKYLIVYLHFDDLANMSDKNCLKFFWVVVVELENT